MDPSGNFRLSHHPHITVALPRSLESSSFLSILGPFWLVPAGPIAPVQCTSFPAEIPLPGHERVGGSGPPSAYQNDPKN